MKTKMPALPTYVNANKENQASNVRPLLNPSIFFNLTLTRNFILLVNILSEVFFVKNLSLLFWEYAPISKLSFKIWKPDTHHGVLFWPNYLCLPLCPNSNRFASTREFTLYYVKIWIICLHTKWWGPWRQDDVWSSKVQYRYWYLISIWSINICSIKWRNIRKPQIFF